MVTNQVAKVDWNCPIGVLRRRVSPQLEGVAEDSALLEIDLLLMELLGLSRAGLLLAADRLLSDSEQAALAGLVERRRAGEPIAYIVGYREFWSLRLEVSPATLIPRPETELLVEKALALPLGRAARVADLGTGSGAIALALAKERPAWQLVATDFSAMALEVAARNITRLQLKTVELRRGSWFAPLAGERFDLIISNPPYVADRHDSLCSGDTAREPDSALASGKQGLDDLILLITAAADYLQPEGWLILEHGYDQQAVLLHQLKHWGWRDLQGYQDLAGLDRCVVARRPA